MSHFIPTDESPWVVIYKFTDEKAKTWRCRSILHGTRKGGRAEGKQLKSQFPKIRTRVVRAWIPTK